MPCPTCGSQDLPAFAQLSGSLTRDVSEEESSEKCRIQPDGDKRDSENERTNSLAAISALYSNICDRLASAAQPVPPPRRAKAPPRRSMRSPKPVHPQTPRPVMRTDQEPETEEYCWRSFWPEEGAEVKNPPSEEKQADVDPDDLLVQIERIQHQLHLQQEQLMKYQLDGEEKSILSSDDSPQTNRSPEVCEELDVKLLDNEEGKKDDLKTEDSPAVTLPQIANQQQLRLGKQASNWVAQRRTPKEEEEPRRKARQPSKLQETPQRSGNGVRSKPVRQGARHRQQKKADDQPHKGPPCKPPGGRKEVKPRPTDNSNNAASGPPEAGEKPEPAEEKPQEASEVSSEAKAKRDRVQHLQRFVTLPLALSRQRPRSATPSCPETRRSGASCSSSLPEEEEEEGAEWLRERRLFQYLGTDQCAGSSSGDDSGESWSSEEECAVDLARALLAVFRSARRGRRHRRREQRPFVEQQQQQQQQQAAAASGNANNHNSTMPPRPPPTERLMQRRRHLAAMSENEFAAYDKFVTARRQRGFSQDRAV